jgi:hypothetical protein
MIIHKSSIIFFGSIFIILLINSNLLSSELQGIDTCVTGYKIKPERSFYVFQYQVGDTSYPVDKINDFLNKNQSSCKIIKSSTIFLKTGAILCISATLFSSFNIFNVNNDPYSAFTVLGIDLIGLSSLFYSMNLHTKAIKAYNKSICSY